MLDELSKHGLIHQVAYLIDLINHTTLSYFVHTGLIGLLVKLASGSMVVVKTLFDLNISSILKEIFSIYDLSHGVPSPRTIDGHYNQMHEVLKLLIQLLPVVSRNQEVPLDAEKEAFLVTHPDLVEKFGNDLLHVLIQVVDSGVDLYICYGCLSVVDKLLYYSNSDMLIDLLKSTNISRGRVVYRRSMKNPKWQSYENIALLGAIQSLFEGSMYTFVFLWTPALSPNGEDIPHGFIFATFMLSSMLGSSLASRLLAHTLTYIDIVLCCVHTLLKGLEKIIASADIPMFVCGDFISVPGRLISRAC
ncbi:unnamed protein product [Lactuca saligna]|uniref:Uncharacterized protein n=1 Tax=Lactuca saligna TaxID=75948 RepID=A0AA35Y3G1_LACSI|nr:unnamed protein product [Lactuca saligna]